MESTDKPSASLKAWSPDRALCVMVLISMLAVILVQRVWRHLPTSAELGLFLQGTLPNFFAATGACAAFMLILNKHLKSNKVIFLASAGLLSFLGLTLWEFLQFWLWQYPIDHHDILMTAIGSLLAAITGAVIYRKHQKLPKEQSSDVIDTVGVA